MKRKGTYLLPFALIFMMICSFPVFAVTREDAVKYAESKVGTVVGSGQCVAFVKDYYKKVFDETVWGNGSDYINNVPNGFTQYLYGEDEWDPRPGDIVSWSWNKYGGKYGHVGIITRADSEGFYYLNQNPYPVKESRFTYGQSGWTLAGVVRPPFEDDLIIEHPKQLEEGSFAIISSASGKYVNVYVDKITQAKNNTVINLYKPVGGDKNDTQRFTFVKTDDDTYLIQPRKSDYTMNVSSLKTGSKVICWKNLKKNNEEWVIEPVENGEGYTFRLKNQPDMYLTQNGDSLKIQKKTGKKNQIFFIQ